jgi:hypothetical protein
LIIIHKCCRRAIKLNFSFVFNCVWLCKKLRPTTLISFLLHVLQYCFGVQTRCPFLHFHTTDRFCTSAQSLIIYVVHRANNRSLKPSHCECPVDYRMYSSSPTNLLICLSNAGRCKFFIITSLSFSSTGPKIVLRILYSLSYLKNKCMASICLVLPP